MAYSIRRLNVWLASYYDQKFMVLYLKHSVVPILNSRPNCSSKWTRFEIVDLTEKTDSLQQSNC